VQPELETLADVERDEVGQALRRQNQRELSARGADVAPAMSAELDAREAELRAARSRLAGGEEEEHGV
jgi:hypothetical protein